MWPWNTGPLRPGSDHRPISTSPSSSNRQTSIACACADQTATFTPVGVRLAPSGSGEPSMIEAGPLATASGGAFGGQAGVELGISPRRLGPGDVGGPAGQLQPPPGGPLPVEAGGAAGGG